MNIVERKIVCLSAGKIAEKNYLNTVKTPVKKDKIIHLLDKNFELILKQYNQVSLWGLRNSEKNEKQWKKLLPGDIAVFYSNGYFISYATILGTTVNAELASYLWNDFIYKYIIILSPVNVIKSPKEYFFKAFSYSSKLKIQGMMIPKIELQKKYLIHFNNNIQEFLKSILNLDTVII